MFSMDFRILKYGFVMSIFIIIINLLRYNNNFKNLTYESSFLEVVSYVVTGFMGNGYIGIYPISKIGKILIIFLSLFKFLILKEIVFASSTPAKYTNIFYGIKDIVNYEILQVNKN